MDRRPKGTGFLKFKTADAANAAVSSANAASGVGIFLKGRQLKVLNALDKKSAHDKELEKSKNDNHDHRNLYLAQVPFFFLFPSVLKECPLLPYNPRFPVFVFFI